MIGDDAALNQSIKQMTTYREEYERIVKIQKNYPTFVGWDHVRNTMLPYVALATVVVTIVFMLAIQLMKRLTPRSPTKAIYKSAYQITNCLVNALLGIVGLYYFNNVLKSNPSVDDRVIGPIEVAPITCFQFGYNLWAIPVGLSLVDETPAMLLHHVAVLFVTTMSAIGTTGHGWYSPFMYGVMELSSVPLAVMNAFKDRPEYIQKYPITYTIIRYTFAFSFLYIRWYLYLPLKFELLRTLGFATVTQRSPVGFAVSAFSWLGAFLLCILQLMWGYQVIKGISKGIFGLVFGLLKKNKGKTE